MDEWLSLLLLIILFFVMMRFGCGSHMMSGHGKSHSDNEDKPDRQKHIDPVCGVQIEVEQGYGKMHEGNLYRFCSRDCLDKFEADPERYTAGDLVHSEHHHKGDAL